MYEWLPPDVELMTETSAAGWVEIRLKPWEQDAVRLHSYMPDAFDLYARMFHPAGERGGAREGVRWAELAARSGRLLGAESSFFDASGIAPGDYERLDDVEPLAGAMPEGLLGWLTGFLGSWTEQDELTWMCLWDGNGTWWKGSHDLTSSPGDPKPDEIAQDERIDGERDAVLRITPRVIAPARGYFLFRGSLGSALDLYGHAGGQSPNLWWPESRRWFVSTEVDAHSTYIGGPRELIEGLCRSNEIEAIELPITSRIDMWG